VTGSRTDDQVLSRLWVIVGATMSRVSRIRQVSYPWGHVTGSSQIRLPFAVQPSSTSSTRRARTGRAGSDTAADLITVLAKRLLRFSPSRDGFVRAVADQRHSLPTTSGARPVTTAR
jgi:hypothetical protein